MRLHCLSFVIRYLYCSMLLYNRISCIIFSLGAVHDILFSSHLRCMIMNTCWTFVPHIFIFNIRYVSFEKDTPYTQTYSTKLNFSSGFPDCISNASRREKNEKKKIRKGNTTWTRACSRSGKVFLLLKGGLRTHLLGSCTSFWKQKTVVTHGLISSAKQRHVSWLLLFPMLCTSFSSLKGRRCFCLHTLFSSTKSIY